MGWFSQTRILLLLPREKVIAVLEHIAEGCGRRLSQGATPAAVLAPRQLAKNAGSPVLAKHTSSSWSR
jgi:hypothetical protein